jgi:hypothetical protein
MGDPKMKPKGLRETAVLMGLCNPLGYAFIEPSYGMLALQLFVASLILAVSYLILWYYWMGRNWARLLVLATSALALANLSFLASSSPFQKIILTLEAILGGFLIFWLNTREIRTFFRQSKHA